MDRGSQKKGQGRAQECERSIPPHEPQHLSGMLDCRMLGCCSKPGMAGTRHVCHRLSSPLSRQT